MNKLSIFKIWFFLLLFLITVNFLLFNDWYWWYLDAGYEYEPMVDYWKIFFLQLQTLWIDTFFWYDNWVLWWARFIWGMIEVWLKYLFWYKFWLVAFFWLFFLSSFLTMKCILWYFYDKNTSYIWALFFAFNPVSLYFVSQPGFIFSYFSWALFLLSLAFIIKERRYYLWTLLLSLSLFFLFSYPRILWIYCLLFFAAFIFYAKEIFLFIKNNKKVFLTITFVIFLVSLPLLSKLYYSYFIDKEYFKWLWNYASTHIWYWNSLYAWMKWTDFYNWIFLTEITDNIQKALFDNIYFKLLFIFVNIYILFFSFFYYFKERQKDKKDNYIFFLIILLIVVVWLFNLAKFVNSDIFTKIYYQYFPFVSNNPRWLFVLIAFIYSFLICYILSKSKSDKKIFAFNFWIIFLYISLISLSFFNNHKLELVKDIPDAYKNTFYKKIWDVPEGSIFYLWSWWMTNWTPYPINLVWWLTSKKVLFSENVRLVNSKQSKLSAQINNEFFYNLAIFNLKNIFIFKDLQNPEFWKIDFYEFKDYVSYANMYYNILSQNNNLYLKQDNKNIAEFWIKDSSNYEFFLYSPSSIIEATFEDFFEKNLSINWNPVIIDDKSFHKSKKIDDFYIPKENQKIKITYKKSLLAPSKIYAKIENANFLKWFLLQLNQTFGMSWKVKWITKEEFEEKNCKGDYKNFKITNNSFCEYDADLLDISGFKYLNRKWVKEQNHFEWNFVWNAWLVETDDIPENMKWQKELYAVIIYEKQIWYSIALVISWFTFTCLLLLTAYQELKNIFKKK